MTDPSVRHDDHSACRTAAPVSWIAMLWPAPGAWLGIRRAAIDAERAFEAAKARGGSHADAADAAYQALTGETQPPASDGNGAWRADRVAEKDVGESKRPEAIQNWLLWICGRAP